MNYKICRFPHHFPPDVSGHMLIIAKLSPILQTADIKSVHKDILEHLQKRIFFQGLASLGVMLKPVKNLWRPVIFGVGG